MYKKRMFYLLFHVTCFSSLLLWTWCVQPPLDACHNCSQLFVSMFLSSHCHHTAAVLSQTFTNTYIFEELMSYFSHSSSSISLFMVIAVIKTTIVIIIITFFSPPQSRTKLLDNFFISAKSSNDYKHAITNVNVKYKAAEINKRLTAPQPKGSEPMSQIHKRKNKCQTWDQIRQEKQRSQKSLKGRGTLARTGKRARAMFRRRIEIEKKEKNLMGKQAREQGGRGRSRVKPHSLKKVPLSCSS